MSVRYVGGIVLLSDSPDVLAEWYRDALGLPFVEQEQRTFYALTRARWCPATSADRASSSPSASTISTRTSTA